MNAEARSGCVDEMSLFRSPELLTSKTLGGARERDVGERTNIIADALEMGTW